MIDLTPIASRLAVEPRALRAILSVESSGSGFADGHPLIRVEAHLLWQNVEPGERPLIDARFKVGGPERWQGHLFDGQVDWPARDPHGAGTVKHDGSAGWAELRGVGGLPVVVPVCQGERGGVVAVAEVPGHAPSLNSGGNTSRTSHP